MENIEIIFENVSKIHLDEFWISSIGFNSENILAANLFSKESTYDIHCLKNKTLNDLFSPEGGGYIKLLNAKIGILLGETIVSFAFDKKFGNVEFNFIQLKSELVSRKTERKNAMALFSTIQELQQKSRAKRVYIGFEPAKDDDMCIISFPNNLSINDIIDTITSMLYV